MECRLGELLLREQLITTTQLKEALESQLACGAKLGSALMELGYVEESALGRALSDKLGVPFVGRKELSAIPGDVVRDIPPSMAVKYNVMPFKLERNRLGLAMSDPNDFRAIEEIGFATGRVIQPYIAPDVHIADARARYYRIDGGNTRYRILAQRRAVPGKYQRRRFLPASRGMVDAGNACGEYEDFSSLNEVLSDETGHQHGASRPVEERRSLGEMAGAHSWNEVADLLISWVGRSFGSGALFLLRGRVAIGWRGVRDGGMIAPETMEKLILGESSVIRDVAESGHYSIGQLMATPENLGILELLGISQDASLFVLPLLLHKRAVSVLLVLAEMEDPTPCMDELRSLVYEATQVMGALVSMTNRVSQ